MRKYNSFRSTNGNTNSNYVHFRKVLILLLIFSVIFQGFITPKVTKADSLSQVNVSVNYIEEVINVLPGSGGSTKFYMSTDNEKTWEMIEDTGTVDISTLLSTKAVTLKFKGNKDQTVKEVTLAAEDKSLQVAYKVVSGSGLIAFTPVQNVEYKKGVNGTWKTASNLMPTSMYEIKGATLYFRTPATVDKRSGKVITVKIPKKPSAPSVKLDGSKLSITGLKPGETQYRVGDSTTWLTFNPSDTKLKSLDLNILLNSSAGTNIVIPAGRIEFRSKGNEKKLDSSVKVIEVPLQPVVPDSIILTNTTLKITDSNTKRAYEYTVVTKGTTLDLEKAKWSAATAKSPVIVRNAAVGDKILVRLKSTTDPTTKKLLLASTYKEFIVTQVTNSTR